MGKRMCGMRFVSLVKFKKKPKDVVSENVKMIEEESKKGIKFLSINWTLGRYDAVAIFEAPNEKRQCRWLYAGRLPHSGNYGCHPGRRCKKTHLNFLNHFF